MKQPQPPKITCKPRPRRGKTVIAADHMANNSNQCWGERWGLNVAEKSLRHGQILQICGVNFPYMRGYNGSYAGLSSNANKQSRKNSQYLYFRIASLYGM